ncbi:hypothetical protein KOW79_019591 [Hemibagrus wyckioides]|uniref:Uncharacterized protein n=1 Tax=Hemibagrus wyckioides TaxID=337641 RepID=A0A9D3N9J9_9TELE|nr:hypothetical protein KOW79_019591 [Hemibagrus wyckioides]
MSEIMTEDTLTCLPHPLIPALDSHAEAASLLGNFQIGTPGRFRNPCGSCVQGARSGKAETDEFSWRPWEINRCERMHNCICISDSKHHGPFDDVWTEGAGMS